MILGSQTLPWFLIIQFPASEEKSWFILWIKIYIFYKWTDLRLIEIIKNFSYKANQFILGVSGHFLKYFTYRLQIH